MFTIILLTMALVPTIILLAFIYKMDSYEKEPTILLLQLFLLGIASIIPAIILEELGTAFLGAVFESENTAYNLVYAFLIVALAEEGGKFFFTYIRTWKSREFNFKFDGIVYTVFTSLGFATLENILYVFGGDGVSIAIKRALLSVPSHAIDAVFMGYFYGKAKFCDIQGDRKNCRKNLWLSFITACLLHGFYDFCLFEGTVLTTLLFFLFVVVIDICAIVRVIRSSKENHALYHNYYSNIYGNVYIPNQYVPYYQMQGAQVSIRESAPGQYPPQAPFVQTFSYEARPHSVVQNQAHGTFSSQRTMYIYCGNCGNLCNIHNFRCAQCGSTLQQQYLNQ